MLTAWCTAERLGLTPLGEQFADSVRSAYGHVLTTDTDFAGRQFDWLRRGQLDLLAMRLPISEPDVAIGPILSHEPHVLVVADDHPLAGGTSVSSDYTLPCGHDLPRELMDAFVPPRTPSGRPVRRR